MCSFVGASFASGFDPDTPIGTSIEGGFFGGLINDGGTTYALIVAPKSSGESSKAWQTNNTTTMGTTSTTDGPSNTATLNSPLNPAGQFCAGLSIGGFSDWYLPARDEIEVLYYHLKPTTQSNTTSFGTNTNAVPARNSNYTSGDPSQTSVTLFQTGNTEAFSTIYWCSTEFDSAFAYVKDFRNGNEFANGKDAAPPVRAVRRVGV